MADCLVRCFRNYIKPIIIGAVLLALVMTQFQVQHGYLSQGRDLIARGRGTASSRQILTNSAGVHNTDYWPKVSLSVSRQIFSHEGRSVRHTVCFVPRGHGTFSFYVNQPMKSISLPFLYYYGTHYDGTLDGRPIKLCNDRRQLMTIDSVPKGSHRLRIKALPGRTAILQHGITGLGIVLYGVGAVKRYNEKRKHN